MPTVGVLERGRQVRPNDDEALYEVVNGVKVYPRDEEVDDQTVDGVRDDALYEVVRGVRVEPEPMASRAALLNYELARQLGNHVKGAGLGRVQSEGLFLLDSVSNQQRRPDSAFVSYERWPRTDRVPVGAAWPVVPDLAIEIVSPTDRAEAALEKIREYFEAGVRTVWVVYPELRIAHVFGSFTSIRVVGGEDILDGGEIVPGFRVPLASIFEDLDG